MIHPTAIIDSNAELAPDVAVGPYSVIGPQVHIDAGTVIGPHVVIRGPSRIGKSNRIFQFSSIGEDCQDRKYKGEPTELVLGDHNVIREGVTIHRGTVQDEGITRVGNHNLFMAYVHVAHDCVVGNHCTFANNAAIAGHVHIGDGVVLGGFSGIHQFCRVGSYAMTSLHSVVNMDIPAFVMVQGYPARARGMNVEGMRRRGYSPVLIRTLRQCYRLLYRSEFSLAEALQQLEGLAIEGPEVQLFIDSIKASTRGITRES